MLVSDGCSVECGCSTPRDCLERHGTGRIVKLIPLTLSLSPGERGLQKQLRNSSLSQRERVGVRVMKSRQAPIVARFGLPLPLLRQLPCGLSQYRLFHHAIRTARFVNRLKSGRFSKRDYPYPPNFVGHNFETDSPYRPFIMLLL